MQVASHLSLATMSEVFAGIKHLLKPSSTCIDNGFFKLHYKATMYVLVACSLLFLQKQYFSDPIDCLMTGDKIPSDVLDAHCWVSSGYTVPKYLDGKVGEDVVHPGVGGASKPHERKYHNYYQWVTLFIFFQALLFYMPRYLWKAFEGGKMKMLVAEMSSPIVDEDVKKSRMSMIVNYFNLNLHQHNFYAIKYTVCELLNFVNVIGQMYFTDRFLGYEFLEYGTDVLKFTEQDIGTRHDPMDRVFPKVMGCTFHQYGSVGIHNDNAPGKHQQTFHALCVVPLNILSEKVFIFLWFWYIIVATLTGIGLVYRVATFFPNVRAIIMKLRARLTPAVAVEQVASKCNFDDWLILTFLAKNMDPLIFKDFMMELGRKFKGVDD